MDKDKILENYMNTINLGQNTLGVQAASLRYFGKPVYELKLSECAVIAGITQNPSRYNPISHPEENEKRKKKVLTNMLEQGYITQEEYDEAIEDDVYARIQTVNEESEDDSVYTYFVDALTKDILEDLGGLPGTKTCANGSSALGTPSGCWSPRSCGRTSSGRRRSWWHITKTGHPLVRFRMVE